MTSHRIRILLSCIAAVVGLVAPAVPAQAAPDTTVVTLRVPRCEGCSFLPSSHALASNGTDVRHAWTGDPVTVRRGVARFRIPTAYTRGMVLGVRTPWMRIDGTPSGPLVRLQNAVGSSYTFQWACWRGTTRPRATIRITVVREVKKNWTSPIFSDRGPMTLVWPSAYLSSLPRPAFLSNDGGHDWYWGCT